MQAVKTVTLDAHTERSQMAVISPEGGILIELQVETTPKELRRVVSGIPGPKKVILENGPLSAMIHDALDGVAEEVVSCDPTKNALVSRSDSSNDRLDARRLGILDRARSAGACAACGCDALARAVQDLGKPRALRLHACLRP